MSMIKTIINEIMITVKSYFCGFKNRASPSYEKGNILIPYANIFGDIVLLLDCIDEFDRLYPKEKGYKVTFICKLEVIQFISTLKFQSGLR